MSKAIQLAKPTFGEALKFWSVLGWISFGGTAGHIAIMHDFLVDRKRWISNASFLHALSLCMLLPGPEAQQLAIYVGWQLHGKKGGILAGTLFVLPSMFILLVFSMVYVRCGNQPWLLAAFGGLKPAVIALVLTALVRVGKRALRGTLHVLVAVGAFVAMWGFDASLPIVMGAVIAIAIGTYFARPALLHLRPAKHDDGEADEPESGNGLRRHVGSAALVIGSVLVLWVAPLAVLSMSGGDVHFWTTETLFFTKAACVTLGGSYTVIPYVASVAVSKFQWLSIAQMTDGFALAETTPGPLIIVVAFVGFMAGYNHSHGSMAMGSTGLLLATFYTFLPCFLFVFLGAPMVGKSEGSPLLDGVLGLVTSVVVGAIGVLTVFLVKSTLLTHVGAGVHLNGFALVWMAIVLLWMSVTRVKVVYVVLLSIAAGIVWQSR